MKVIVIEEEAYYTMLREFADMVKKAAKEFKVESEWLTEQEAKDLLGIKSKSKLQQLRDSLDIEFSQHGKIIRYSKSSILAFLEKNRVRY